MLKEYRWGNGKVIETFVPASKEWVPRLLESYLAQQDQLTFSHRINDRWENAYLPIDLIPEARIPIRYARELGSEKFACSLCMIYMALEGSGNPYPPFWFNSAMPGESTGLHDHADFFALSGVVYLQCEKSSGNLFFHQDGVSDLEIMPEVGKLLLFEPKMKHGVRENLGDSARLSMAFNLLPFPLPTFNL